MIVKQINRLLKSMVNLILIIIVLTLGYLKLSHQSLPIQMMNVLTGSMTDTFKPGSLVVIYQVPTEKLKVGDVITYQNEGELVTHRIIKINQKAGQNVFITQGDNNNSADHLIVTPAMIQGKLWLSVPYLGRFGEIIQTSRGHLAITLTFIQIWLLIDLLGLILEISHEKRKAVV